MACAITLLPMRRQLIANEKLKTDYFDINSSVYG